mgnify:CR=1 FL=1
MTDQKSSGIYIGEDGVISLVANMVAELSVENRTYTKEVEKIFNVDANSKETKFMSQSLW